MNDETNITAFSFPKVPDDLSSIVKPEELVDIVEMSPLTLQDRRIYNLLIGNAWNDILSKPKHTISRKRLTEHANSNNHDIEASFRRLMSSIVQIRINRNRDGEESVRQISLLGSNEIGKRSNVSYSFPPDLMEVIKNTQIFARLHTKVMFELSSKYSLALYEFLQRRKNMQYKRFEVFSVEELKGLLGVPSGKLKTFGHFNKYALQPALDEVSFLTEYEIQAEPKRTGRKITHIKIAWSKKTNIGHQIEAVEELQRSKTGRRARMKGQMELLEIQDSISLSQITDSSINLVSVEALESAKNLVFQSGTGWDVYAIQNDFNKFSAQKGEKLNNVDGAFIGFVKNKIKKQP